MHPKWDGPFVVLASSDKDAYQLATANGYILRNVVNITRIRKLSADECTKNTGEFCNTSEWLKSQDERARQEQELLDVNKRLSEATIEHIQAQKVKQIAPQNAPDVAKSMAKIAEVAKEKRELEKAIKAGPAQSTSPSVVSEKPTGVGKRLRKLPWKLRDM